VFIVTKKPKITKMYPRGNGREDSKLGIKLNKVTTEREGGEYNSIIKKNERQKTPRGAPGRSEKRRGRGYVNGK